MSFFDHSLLYDLALVFQFGLLALHAACLELPGHHLHHLLISLLQLVVIIETDRVLGGRHILDFVLLFPLLEHVRFVGGRYPVTRFGLKLLGSHVFDLADKLLLLAIPMFLVQFALAQLLLLVTLYGEHRAL